MNSRAAIDYALYLITDAQLARGRSLRDVVQAAIQGGVTVVQYREKQASARRMIEHARELRDVCRDQGVTFIVNDRVDVALALEADGVHVGQDDMPASLVRTLIGPGKILGVSADTAEQALAAQSDGADYIGAGPIYPTDTKTDTTPPIGLSGLEDIVRAFPLPVVAIGGLKASNAGLVIRAGAAGVAVVSAIVGADDACAAARELRAAIDRSRGR